MNAEGISPPLFVIKNEAVAGVEPVQEPLTDNDGGGGGGTHRVISAVLLMLASFGLDNV